MTRMTSDAFFTTAEVGRTFGGSPRTACKLIDSGQLRGFKIPGSACRRVASDDLRAFLLKSAIPLTEFELILASKQARRDRSAANKKLNR